MEEEKVEVADTKVLIGQEEALVPIEIRDSNREIGYTNE